ncbi:uncharacterized protein LOC117179634 [Belonocnema kinseyi]|uniref:uncharacterized protein LOC117179634 n=1 Tax=Belonocnema kinseyi TaxID=2817044 RepID=UPI00143D5471|nr:uncharacterized protein LOC117179634 [Belonocnema kinseyi]
MGNRLSSRVTPSRPFTHCGIDYAGPVDFLRFRERKSSSWLACISIFVCFATRAIHLELVVDYTSDAIIGALKCLIGSGGLPKTIYSDNGTTFQGADCKLREHFKMVNRDPNVCNYFAAGGLFWKMIPPQPPHFVGLWEARVKSTKNHLRFSVGDKKLTFKELTMLLCQIEACLNSRSINAESDSDPDNFVPLTPGYILTGSPILSLPEPSYLDVEDGRLDS